MKVTFRVLQGPGVGRQFGIPTPRCLIGREEHCQFRPYSEAISPRHCVVYVRDGRLFVWDLKSRDGTFVNGQRIREDCELRGGDELRLGRLAFEVQIEHEVGGEKESPPPQIAFENTGEAAARMLKEFFERRQQP